MLDIYNVMLEIIRELRPVLAVLRRKSSALRDQLERAPGSVARRRRARRQPRDHRGVLYAATNDPAPKYQTFGTLACLADGVPVLVLGLHGLISADEEREDVKPGPVPNWYGPGLMRVHGGPAAIAEARGALSPGVSLGGAF